MDLHLFNNFRLVDLLLILFVLAAIVQIFYYLYFFRRVGLSDTKIKKAKKAPVSIVICAKDEAVNLKNNLPAILDQNYPDFEVVVVNDCSEDGTEEILVGFLKKYSNLRVTTIKKDPKFTHGKKLALTIGIKAAKHEWLLLTDADCKPESAEWVSSMQKNFTNDNSIVLGYGGFYQRKGLLNTYIRFDTFFIALQYLSFALAGNPFMGVGRNLAYRRSLFFDQKGFASHNKLASGDDDLFVNQSATANNTKTEYSEPAQVRAEAKKTFRGWVKQKKRHLTTGWHYNRKTKWLLGTELFSRITFYILFILLLVFLKYVYVVLGAFLIRSIIMGVVFKNAMNRLNEKYLFLSSQVYDFISPIVNILLVLANKFSSREVKWK
ncbi:MAG: glycosyltransferase [Bacteroidales bacterium]|nr:glycosyltransferase [Bacteroidales bacterium]